MKRSFLEELGLEKEVIEKIMLEHGKAVEASKGDNAKLTADLDGKKKEHAEALALIEKLKGENAGNEKLQTAVKDYESKVAQLTAENQQLKIDKAIELALLENKAKASDIDYLAFKLKQDHKELTLDDNGKIKGIDDIVSGLKTAYASNFEGTSKRAYEPNELPQGEPAAKEPKNLIEALQQSYEQS